MKFSNICIIGLTLVVLLSGCATKQELPRFVWPAPPDDPKLEFVGNFYSEQEIRKSQGTDIVNAFLGAEREFALKTPFGILSDGKGQVYVADTHAHNVWVFDFNAGKLKTISALSLFQSPAGMALSDDGTLYVADIDRGRIVKFSKDHKLIGTIEGADMERPAYLALSPDGNRLYASEPAKHRILVFDPDSGKPLYQFGERGGEQGQFNYPQGLAFGPEGKLYVVDSLNARIQVLEPNGEPISAFGERGDQAWQFENPKDLAFDSEWNMHVVESRASMIKTFSSDGKLLLVTGDGKSTFNPFGFAAPKSIFIDQTDRIYVSESLGKRFTIWQYMSEEYLQLKPYTMEDKQRLLEYMEDVANQENN